MLRINGFQSGVSAGFRDVCRMTCSSGLGAVEVPGFDLSIHFYYHVLRPDWELQAIEKRESRCPYLRVALIAVAVGAHVLLKIRGVEGKWL